jgi:pimeloyl-ACP methyl ester carboxylesterase
MELWLGPRRFDIYRSIERLMAHNGYTVGNLRRPEPGANFFFFPYDWRYDNVHAAGELARQLERLRAMRGADRLRVALVCHSDSAHVARYFVKYGGVPLEEAESGRSGPPPGIQVEKVIFIATANGGALEMLRLLHRGRTYVPLAGRHWSPEMCFTFDAFYQHLPAYRDDLFFDARGAPIQMDIFDPVNWERFGWSIYEPVTRARLARAEPHGLFGDAAQRAAHLAERLDNARRFYRLLAGDVEGFGGTRYYSLQSNFDPTPARALLAQKDGRWRTAFARDFRVRSNAALAPLAIGPGDGYATQESQSWVSPQERAALALPTVYIDGGHLKLMLHPAAQRWLLEMLARDP